MTLKACKVYTNEIYSYWQDKLESVAEDAAPTLWERMSGGKIVHIWMKRSRIHKST